MFTYQALRDPFRFNPTPRVRESTELAAPITLTLPVKDAALAHRPKEAAGEEPPILGEGGGRIK